jgi:mannose-6-phosphate isomerase-like protein (cupin superfamily)
MARSRIVNNQATAEYFFREGCHITEWLNESESDELSIARARVDSGVTTRLHRLTGITERYVILEGRGMVTVGQRVGEAVGPGDVVIIPSGESQQITNTGDEALIFLAICTPRFRPEAYFDLE